MKNYKTKEPTREPHSLVKSSKLSVGIALILLGLILTIANKDGQETVDVSRTFASEPVEVIGFSSYELEDVEVPQRVIVPSVGINLEVGISEVVGGYWEVFDDRAGWGVGSGLPGTEGNQVVFAHAREGLFAPLNAVQVGDKVYILTGIEWYEYEIDDIYEVYPDQVEVIAPTDDERLTLYTCSGYQDSTRLIVVAKRV